MVAATRRTTGHSVKTITGYSGISRNLIMTAIVAAGALVAYKWWLSAEAERQEKNKEPIPEFVSIHGGGSKKSAYNILINEHLNWPSIDINYDCETEEANCVPIAYEFESACDDGGSYKNLVRLGNGRRRYER